MSINVDADEGSSTVSVSGQTTRPNMVITMTIIAPNGNVVDVDQLTPDPDGSYMTEVKINSFWKADGLYTINVQQSSSTQYQLSGQVGVTGGVAMATSDSDSSLDFGHEVVRPVDVAAGLEIMIDAPVGSTVIGVTGHTENPRMDVTLSVNAPAPHRNLIHIDQITPDADGNFETVINMGCAKWEQDGFYTITASQSESNLYTDSAEVDVLDCAVIPEFGTVAVLVLAVAIVSIIAVTARSRLSVIPRF